MKIEVYSKDNCLYCLKAIELLDSHNQQYDLYKLDKDFTRESLLEAFPTAKSFPLITINDEYIGGYADLLTFLQDKNKLQYSEVGE